MANIMLRSIARQIRDLNVSKVGYTSFYVDADTGSDDNSGGGWDDAFVTVQNAVDEGGSWAQIFIASGTYPEQVTIPSASTHIEMHGASMLTTRIKPDAGYNGIACYADECAFEGIRIDMTNHISTPAYPAFYCNGSSFGRVRNCVVEGDIAHKVAVGMYLQDCSRWDISRVYLYGLDSCIQMVGVDTDHITMRNHIHDCELTRSNFGIWLIDHCRYNVFDDDIYLTALSTGVYFYLDSAGAGSLKNNTVTHCVFDTSITNNVIEQDGPNNIIENYYDGYTTDTDKDGICDAPYAYTGGTDEYPVSIINRWKNKTLGFGSGYFPQVVPIKMNSKQTLNSTAGNKVFVNGVLPHGLITTVNSRAKKVMLLLTGVYVNTFDGTNAVECATGTDNQWQYKAGGAGTYADLVNTGTDGQMSDEDWKCPVKGASGSFSMMFDITSVADDDIDAAISVQLQNGRVEAASMEVALNAFLTVLWAL